MDRETFKQIYGVEQCHYHDWFEIEYNVPKALIGNPHVEMPENTNVRFDGYLITVASYKTAYPGLDPHRFKAFMVTPKENRVTTYPITGIDSIKLNRTEDERYFVSLADMINCVHYAQVKGIRVHEVGSEYGARTAQEMIEFFKQFESDRKDYYLSTSSNTPTDDSK